MPPELSESSAASECGAALDTAVLLQPAEADTGPSESSVRLVLTDNIPHQQSLATSDGISCSIPPHASADCDAALGSSIARIEIHDSRLQVQDSALPLPLPPSPPLLLLRLWPDALLTAIVTFVEPVDTQLRIIDDAFS